MANPRLYRTLVAGLAVALVGGSIAYDVATDDGDAIANQELNRNAVVNPSLGNPARLDSAWYCPIGSTEAGGYADHEVIISNLGALPAVATLQILAGTSITAAESEEEEPTSFGSGTRIDIAPGETERVRLSKSGSAAQASAVVEVVGGRAVVGHTVETETGIAEGPCATHVSNSWYFAAGRTEPDSNQYLALMNPFPEAAVFDVKFQTLVRDREPGKLQGAFVAPKSVRLIAVDEFMPREEVVATTVTAQRGRLVVERLQLMNGDAGPRGAALQLGVPSPSDLWTFTAGVVTNDGEQTLTIFNPATETNSDQDEENDEEVVEPPPAEVKISLWPTNPTDRTKFAIKPIVREIPAGSFEVVDLVAQAERFQLPLPYALTVVVISSDPTVKLVAERWQYGKPVLQSIESLEAEADAEDEPEAETETGSETEAEAETVDEDDDLAVLDSTNQKVQEAATEGLATSRGTEQFSTRWVIPWVTAPGEGTGVVSVWSPKSADDTEVGSIQVKSYINGKSEDIESQRAVLNNGREMISFSAPEGAVIEVVSKFEISVEAMVVEKGESMSVVPAIPTESNSN